MRARLKRLRKNRRVRSISLIIFCFSLGCVCHYLWARIFAEPAEAFSLQVNKLALSSNSEVTGESVAMPTAERAQTGFLYGYHAELELDVESLGGPIKSGYLYYAPDNLFAKDLEVNDHNFKEINFRKAGDFLSTNYRLKEDLTYLDNSPGAIKDIYLIFENQAQEVCVEVLLLKVEKQFDYTLKEDRFKLTNKKGQAEWQDQENYQVYKVMTKNDFFDTTSQELTFKDGKNYTVNLAKYVEIAKLVKSHYLNLK